MKDRHKVRIRKSKEDYTDWLNDSEISHNDAISGENRWDGHSPFIPRWISDIESDRVEALHDLYPSLKGRQKEIVDALFEGMTSQTEIAKLLKMKQSNVAIELRKIMKKILKKVI